MRGRNNKAGSVPTISLGADKPWARGVNPVEVAVKPRLEHLGLPGTSKTARADAMSYRRILVDGLKDQAAVWD
jgi:hypothetical protein